MAGGGVFTIVLLLISGAITVIWLLKGKGALTRKFKILAGYLALTIAPAIALEAMGEKGYWPVLLSNVAFFLIFMTIMSGFVLPYLAKRFPGE